MKATCCPLTPSNLNTLAVIGPNAAPIRLGGYSGDPGCAVSVLDGIRRKVGSQVNVLYAEGCGLTQSTNDAGQMWYDDEVLLTDPDQDTALIAAAVATARQARRCAARPGRQ
jgi:beta-glucosidase